MAAIIGERGDANWLHTPSSKNYLNAHVSPSLTPQKPARLFASAPAEQHRLPRPRESFRVTPRRVWGALGEQNFSPAGLYGGLPWAGVRLSSEHIVAARTRPAGLRGEGVTSTWAQSSAPAQPPRNTNQTKTPALEAQGGISPWLPASGASLTGGSLSTRAAARELWLQRQRRSGIPPAPREVAVGFTPGHQNHSGAGGEAGQGTASILCP